MKKILTYLALLFALTVSAQTLTDPRSIRLNGIPIEGPIDSLRQALTEAEFAEWGQSDDGEDYYFRGNFYGIRAKLMVSITPETKLVNSAYVTIGPYSTNEMLERNLQYFRYKMEQDYGHLSERDDTWFYIDDFGSIKMSVVDNDNGSRDIRILFLNTVPFYKDALTMGLHADVEEVVTENAVAEDQFLHFNQNGMIDNPDLVDRMYNRYGYLISARMKEKDGFSTITYDYDQQFRLVRRTLVNAAAGISYINDYTYNSEDEPLTQFQKVYNKDGECIMTINMTNNYITRDDNGNWTSNSMTLNYWEKDAKTQQVTVLQRRTIAYWE
jgi:hypothetical protein